MNSTDRINFFPLKWCYKYVAFIICIKSFYDRGYTFRGHP